MLFDRVRNAPLEFPKHVSPDARTIIAELLVRDPAKRIGIRLGAEEVMKQPFFSHIDWAALYERRLSPPFRPRKDAGSLDASNFDKVREECHTVLRRMLRLWGSHGSSCSGSNADTATRVAAYRWHAGAKDCDSPWQRRCLNACGVVDRGPCGDVVVDFAGLHSDACRGATGPFIRCSFLHIRRLLI